MEKLDSSLVEAVYYAAWRSFWHRDKLYLFLRQHGVSDSFIAARCGLTKREVLDEVFAALLRTPKGQAQIVAMGRDLGNKVDFPDLRGHENSDQMLQQAKTALASLRRAMGVIEEAERRARDQNASAKLAEQRDAVIRRTAIDLQELNERLMRLAKDIGTQSAGYSFQAWFYDLMDHSEVTNRRPFEAQGRQIDGSITLGDTTYLVELKFTRQQVGPDAVDSLHKKVVSKADNTMGVLLSMSGFTSGALQEASGPRTPLLLLDHSHIVPCLGGRIGFAELVARVRRHASQTGESYLPAETLSI